MTELKEISSYRSHEGLQKVFTHYSKNLKSVHEFSIYLPPRAVNGQRCPVLYWLTGAAADEREFMMKSGFQKYASENELIVVAPEPSPSQPSNKNKEISADYFVQFGFYLDATEPPYKDNFRMYSYVIDELLPLIDFKFPTIPDKRGLAGHSMGGMVSGPQSLGSHSIVIHRKQFSRILRALLCLHFVIRIFFTASHACPPFVTLQPFRSASNC